MIRHGPAYHDFEEVWYLGHTRRWFIKGDLMPKILAGIGRRLGWVKGEKAGVSMPTVLLSLFSSYRYRFPGDSPVVGIHFFNDDHGGLRVFAEGFLK